MNLLNIIAPAHSRRRLLLKIGRTALRSPASALNRLASVNFHNARLSASLRINCPVCGNDSGVDYDFPDVLLRREHGIGLLRETLACKSCNATMRDRVLAMGLLEVAGLRAQRTYDDLRGLKASPPGDFHILDTDSFSPLNRILRGMPGYTHSQFRADLPPGKKLDDGSLNVNLLQIPFSDHTFDVIMTSDVMEHVADDEQAHREIHRCLKAGGSYVFTVPFDPTLHSTRRLTVKTDSHDRYFILSHHVHGDPHSSSGIIAHRIYGMDFIDTMEAMGFNMKFQQIDAPGRGVYAGDLFIATRKN